MPFVRVGSFEAMVLMGEDDAVAVVTDATLTDEDDVALQDEDNVDLEDENA